MFSAITSFFPGVAREANPLQLLYSEKAISLAAQCVRDFFTNRGAKAHPAPQTPSIISLKFLLGDVVFAMRGLSVMEKLHDASMGFYSMMGAFGGIFACRGAMHQWKEARKLGDVWAGALSLSSWVDGGSRVVMAAAAAVNRASTIATVVNPAATLAGRVADISGVVGDGSFALFGIGLGINSLLNIAQLGSYGIGFELAQGDVAKMEMLMREVLPDISAWVKRAQQEPAFVKELEELALQTLSQSLKVASDNSEGISEGQAKEIYETMLSSDALKESYRPQLLEILKLTPEQAKDLSVLTLFGLVEKVNEQVVLQKKQRNRSLSADMLKTAEKMNRMGIIERLKASSDPEVQSMARKECQEITSQVRWDFLNKLRELLVVLALAAVGAAIGVMSVAAFFGACAVPPLGLTIAFVLLIFLADIGPGIKMWKTMKPQWMDYFLLGVSAVVIICSFATGLGVAIALKHAMIELIKPAITAGVSLLVCALAYRQLGIREQESKLEKPSLQDFATFLEREVVPGEISTQAAAVFDRLSIEDRAAVMGMYRPSSSKYGASFLRQLSVERDIERYTRGVEEAVEASWKEYRERGETMADYRKALALSRLRDLLKEKKYNEAAAHLSKMDSSSSGKAIMAVSTIMKREESLETLKSAVTAVLEKRNNN